jgi:hypothetical protein
LLARAPITISIRADAAGSRHAVVSGGSAMDWTAFAQDWCEAWNAHDVERVLLHFHDDAVFTSPGALRLQPDSGGIVRGKPALRRYWSKALSVIPDLHFTIDHVFAGIDTLVIQYRNQTDVRVSEVLTFEGGKVRSGHGTYPIGLANPVGAVTA